MTRFRALLFVVALIGCGPGDAEIALPDLSRHEEQVSAKLREAHAAVVAQGGGDQWLHFGRVLYAHDEFDAAERAFLEAAGFGDEHRFEGLYLAGVSAAHASAERALTHIEQAITIRDDYAPARLRCGEFAERLGDVGAAERHFRRALELKRSSHSLLGLARVADARGRSAESLELLREANRLDPDHVEVTVQLSATLAALGHREEAERMAATVPPLHARTHFDDPLLLRTTSESVSYRGLLEQAQRAAKAGEIDDAFSFFDRAAAAAPDAVETHLRKGALLAALARFDEAITTYRKVIELDPTNGNAHTRLGHCQEALGRTREAEQAFRDGVRVDPTNANARHGLARFLATTDPDAARGILERLLRDAPDRVDSRLLLAQILARIGHRAAALSQVDVILRQAPDHPEALALRRRLTQ